MNDVALAIRMTADADQAVRAANDVGDAYGRMGSDVQRATDNAEQGTRRMAQGAEVLDEAGGRATGALGALAAGAEAMGMEEYAAKMEHAAMVTDGLSGVGQTASLVMDGYRAVMRNARVATIAHTAATKAQAVATKAQAAAQRVLNAVQRANPIGLIITAILALIAVFVLLYRRNERFREIVQAVMAKARAAVGKVIEVVGRLIGWVRDKLGPAFKVYAQLVQRYIQLVVAVIRRVISIVTGGLSGAWRVMRNVAVGTWNTIRSTVSSVVGKVTGFIGNVRDANARVWDAVRGKVVGIMEGVRATVRTRIDQVKGIAGEIQSKFGQVWDGVKSKADTVFTAIMTPINKVIDAVDKVLDLIAKIDLPDLSDLPGLRVATRGGGVRTVDTGGLSTGGGGLTIVDVGGVHVQGFVGSNAELAAVIRKALRDNLRAVPRG